MARQKQLVHDQHIVPQWHLRRFADARGALWVYKENLPVKERCPKGECWERDFYEYRVKGRSTSNRYENWLGRIENDASTLVDKLLGRTEQIRPSDAVVWASYVASLFLRTQKIRDQKSAALIEGTQSPDFIRNIQYEILRDHGELVLAEFVRNRIEALRASIENSSSYYHLIGLEKTTAALADALMRKNWHFLQAPTGKYFVLSDCPVTTVELGPETKPGVGFGNALAAIILPVTPQHAFVASAQEQWKAVVSPRVVDLINQLTVWFAHKKVFAHENSPQIKTLVDEQINKIVFGRDAFLPSNQN
jgi:hypothetical protein